MNNNFKATKKEMFYDNIADSWELRINQKETQKRIRIVFNELMQNELMDGLRIVEIGCGLGFFSKIMREKGAKVYGIDLGINLVNITAKKVPEGNFSVGNAQTIPFLSNTFDITLCTEVIEHTENPLKALEELFRITKLGGLIVLTTPNKFYKPFFWLLSFLRIRLYQGNENWLGIRELMRIVQLKGGQIIKERYFNFIYPTPVLDYFEKYPILKYLMINQGYLIKKISTLR